MAIELIKTGCCDGMAKKLLIVEDDPIIATDMELFFSDCGFDVVAVAHNVTTALAAIEEHCPDIALLDFQLGQENSLEIAETLDKMKIPFCFLTASSSAQLRHAIFPDAAIFSKPVRYERVVEHIAKYFT
tara:strand:- start:176550 stop:176939 length:390 start_codon:yes stop_codon:yes gene_type:complete